MQPSSVPMHVANRSTLRATLHARTSSLIASFHYQKEGSPKESPIKYPRERILLY